MRRKRIANYDGERVLWKNLNIRSDSVSFGQVRYQPDGYCGPRIQRDYEIVILHSGNCEVRLDDSRHRLRAGLAYLFHPGHRECFRFSRHTETHHSWCSITPKFLPPNIRCELDAAPAAVGFPCSESFNRILSAAFLLRPSSARVTDALGLALFTEFLEIAHQTRAKNSGQDSVRHAIGYMEDHFAEENCLARAQQTAGCSVNALIYKFTDETGLSPSRYLWKLRTEKGIAMLAETGLTVAEIAYKCGFKNPFHFTRRVRHHHGISPRELRRRAWA